MDLLDATVLGLIASAVLMLGAAIGVLVAAVWFGMRVIAPRLQRALDRAHAEDELDRDRND